MIWYPFSLIDYLLSVKFRMKKVVEPFYIKRVLCQFKDYDLICAHSAVPGTIALHVKNKYNIPYTVTWHGSDIHTEPFVNNSYRRLVGKVIAGATVNLFVSKKLRDTASQIFPFIKEVCVSYNGASEMFYKYEASRVELIRKKYGLAENDKVVGFVGGLVPVKNVEILPDIFNRIKNECDYVKFWIIGNGILKKNIENKLREKYPNIECQMFGDQSVEVMADLMNCIDLLLLPSKNEGLPLVTVEALRCAVNVVASHVGGISEVVGENNVIDHGDGFEDRFARRCIEILRDNEPCPELPKQFDWDIIVEKESVLYRSMLHNN